MPPPAPQLMGKPMKSVFGRLRAAVFGGAALEATASFHSAEFTPKTFVISPFGPVPVFSRTMLAGPPALPKSHPARVYGTQGAGIVLGDPLSPLTMFGSGSAGGGSGSSPRSVPKLNDAEENAGTVFRKKH